MAMGTAHETDNILGMAKVNNEVKILLDVDRVIGEGVIRQFEKKQ
jgi:purine-binding chemotaxis protein CheW